METFMNNQPIFVSALWKIDYWISIFQSHQQLQVMMMTLELVLTL